MTHSYNCTISESRTKSPKTKAHIENSPKNYSRKINYILKKWIIICKFIWPTSTTNRYEVLLILLQVVVNYMPFMIICVEQTLSKVILSIVIYTICMVFFLFFYVCSRSYRTLYFNRTKRIMYKTGSVQKWYFYFSFIHIISLRFFYFWF